MVKTTKSVVIRILLWVFMLVGGAIYAYFKDINNPLFHNIYFHISTLVLGILVISISFKAAANGGRALKEYGRVGDIPRLETNKLAKEGIYACMRHPMLFGLTLLPLGWALILGLPTFIFILAPLEMIFIIIMVLTLEEREAIAKFDGDYIAYKRKVPAFSLQCIKKLLGKKQK